MAQVSGCESAGQVDRAQWEPFASRKSLPATLALNWIGYAVAAQFRDDHGITSLIYCDDISLEGMPAVPSVGSTDWYSQVQCFAESDVHPSQGESVTGPTVTFSWPATNNLPDGVFYQVNAYSSVDQYAGLAAQGRTRDNSLALQFSPDKAGNIVWYVVLADANDGSDGDEFDASFTGVVLTFEPGARFQRRRAPERSYWRGYLGNALRLPRLLSQPSQEKATAYQLSRRRINRRDCKRPPAED